jgi:hypothetical protein
LLASHGHLLGYGCREFIASENGNASMGQKSGQKVGNRVVTACELINNTMQLSLRKALSKGWTDPSNVVPQCLATFNCVKVNDNGLAAFKFFFFQFWMPKL